MAAGVNVREQCAVRLLGNNQAQEGAAQVRFDLALGAGWINSSQPVISGKAIPVRGCLSRS